LTEAKDLALPHGQNKILVWVNKYQVGGIFKWSHTLYRIMRKKQPGILLRDVSFEIVKEGGKRWLIYVSMVKLQGKPTNFMALILKFIFSCVTSRKLEHHWYIHRPSERNFFVQV
jgi:hypothetical protein